MYEKLDQREHVLRRPGMYIGSTTPDAQTAWSFDGEAISEREVVFAPALLTIFDEVLMNAVDHAWRCEGGARPVRSIRVSTEGDAVTVWNDGAGIPAEVHEATGVMVPELIFGTLLTSSNYDDAAERTVGGQNGIGAKSTNIFSRWFEVETCDGARRYTQRWEANMSAVGAARVAAGRRAPFTRVTFEPDYARFGAAGLDAATRAVLLKRAADACAVTPAGVSVYVEGRRLPFKTFERYTDLYLGGRGETTRHYERAGEDWEVCVCASPDGAFRQVSFVNGVCTAKGGKHVDHVATVLSKRVAEAVGARRGAAPVKASHVRNSMWLFVRATVPNPAFDSQTKDFLTTPVSAFRARFEPSSALVDRVARGPVGDAALSHSRAGADQSLRKTDGKMRSSVSGIPKLEDANWAGTPRSAQCTLILTEGDSAKTMAVSGLAVVGRDAFGVFPLKGKLLNTRDAAAAKVAANVEIAALKKILGLESGKSYATEEARRTLRYGSVLVLADQDVDGFHIRGLVFNMFHSLWPELFRAPGFLSSMLTPVARVFLPGGAPPRSFYNVPDLERFMSGPERPAGARAKYYKGLGTSTAADARELFREMRRVRYTLAEVPRGVAVSLCVSSTGEEPTGAEPTGAEPTGAEVTGAEPAHVSVRLRVTSQSADDALDLAFNKSRSGDRKLWLARGAGGEPGPDYAAREVPFADFVNRELRLFSLEDLARSIPSAVDGLKPSQRKVLFACRLRPRSVGEVRVAQLAGFVSERAAYHHGEASLQGTIVGLAQDFPGSNNVPLLLASGQFGSRLSNGSDAASARYIYTDLLPVTARLLPAADEPVLARALDDDRNPVEPLHYAPVLPLVLVNGASGIGTGFSCSVPRHDPRAVADAVLARLDGRASAPLRPWVRGLRGEMFRAGDRWFSRGVYRRLAPSRLEVSDLPAGTWTQDYKTWLEEHATASVPLRRVESHYTEREPRFVLHMDPPVLDRLLAERDEALGVPLVETALRLVSDKGLGYGNMVLFDAGGRVRRFESPEEIVDAHFAERLRVYARRREHELGALRRRVAVLSAKAEFVRHVVEGLLVLNGAAPDALATHAAAAGWAEGDGGGYDFLASMPMSSVTRARRESLERERDAAAAELARLQRLGARDLFRAELSAVRAALPAE